ncbi:MAG: addiction module component, family protein [Anaerolinea sp.]|nr:addiction module component, family protein [Anaerolinea sp.]
MSTAAEEVLAQAMKLDADEREWVAEELLGSLETMPPLSEAWQAEIRRRVEEIEDGTAELVPWEEVRDRLYERLHAKREG